MTGRARRAARGLAGPKADKPISLALQGGGAHGAFTWGVLDYILEDGRLAIEAITGANAGAINAVVLLEGWLEGGAQGAREQLRKFWKRVSLEGVLSPIQRSVSTESSAFGVPTARPPISGSRRGRTLRAPMT
jgi:NTE family protein